MQAGDAAVGVRDVGYDAHLANREARHGRVQEHGARSAARRHVLIAGRVDDGVDLVDVPGQGLEL